MEIFCTKKLAGQLPLFLQERTAPGPAFQRWCANIAAVRERTAVLLTHEATLFTVVLCVRQKDLPLFRQTARQAVQEAFLTYGVKEKVLRRFLPRHEAVVLKAAHMENRAAQSAMNRAFRYLQDIWAREYVPNALLQLPAGLCLNESFVLSGKHSLTPMESMEMLLREMSRQEPFAQDYMRLRAVLSFDACETVREFLTPRNYTFHQLHRILRDAFQWTGAHSYRFAVPNDLNVCQVLDANAAVPDHPGGPAMLSRTAVLGRFLSPGQRFDYTYESRIPWNVEVEVLNGRDRVPTWGVICTDSSGISPPDSLPSEEAFLNCLHAFHTPAHPRHAEAVACLRKRSPTAEEINHWL